MARWAEFREAGLSYSKEPCLQSFSRSLPIWAPESREDVTVSTCVHLCATHVHSSVCTHMCAYVYTCTRVRTPHVRCDMHVCTCTYECSHHTLGKTQTCVCRHAFEKTKHIRACFYKHMNTCRAHMHTHANMQALTPTFSSHPPPVTAGPLCPVVWLWKLPPRVPPERAAGCGGGG